MVLPNLPKSGREAYKIRNYSGLCLGINNINELPDYENLRQHEYVEKVLENGQE